MGLGGWIRTNDFPLTPSRSLGFESNEHLPLFRRALLPSQLPREGAAVRVSTPLSGRSPKGRIRTCAVSRNRRAPFRLATLGLVEGLGLEPRSTVSETGVLPLHQPSISMSVCYAPPAWRKTLESNQNAEASLG